MEKHPWSSAFPSQLENSSARAKPARESARGAGNIHPSCWKHRAEIADGGGDHPGRDWQRNPAGFELTVHQIPFSCQPGSRHSSSFSNTSPNLCPVKSEFPGTGFSQQFSVPSAAQPKHAPELLQSCPRKFIGGEFPGQKRKTKKSAGSSNAP